VEPEDGPIVPADFDGLHDSATKHFDQDPDSKLWISTPVDTRKTAAANQAPRLRHRHQ
jgi:hypothetical protein